VAKRKNNHPQITQIPQIENLGHKKAQEAQNEIKPQQQDFIQTNPQLEIFA
jgi:hypothetical protein